jgi:ATP-binding cassette, subfamily B, bacterial
MVVGYLGRTVDLAEIGRSLETSRQGVNAQALIDAGVRFGVHGSGVSIENGALGSLPRAAILHWNAHHFVVFDRLAHDRVHLLDPAFGRCRLSLEEFRRGFSGVAIVFEPSPDVDVRRPSRSKLARYWLPLARRPSLWAKTVAATAVLQLAAVVPALALWWLAHAAVPLTRSRLLAALWAGLIASMAVQAGTRYLRSKILLDFASKLEAQLTTEFVEHLLHLPSSFFHQHRPGDLAARFHSHAFVRQLLTGGLPTAIVDVGSVTLVLLGLFALNVKVAGVTSAVVVAELAFAIWGRRSSRRLQTGYGRAQTRLHELERELLSAIDTIKASRWEEQALYHWKEMLATALDAGVDRERAEQRMQAARGLRPAVPMVVMLAALPDTVAGRLAIGELIALSGLAMSVLAPIARLMAAIATVQPLRWHLDRIDDVLQRRRESASSGESEPHVDGRVTARRISFRYAAHSPVVVCDVSLDVRAGSMLAIVGLPGSGKSTLVKLLGGLLAPSTGHVVYDDRDLAHLDSTAFRRHVALLGHDPALFAGSVAANIGFADGSMPLDVIVRAARTAQVHDAIVALPMGYDSMPARSALPSIALQQQIALARALVSQPRLLFLDDAISEVPAQVERAIHGELARLGCTRVVVSRRVDTLALADRIVVVDRGRIIEEGTHAELVDLRGVYAGLVAGRFLHSDGDLWA